MIGELSKVPEQKSQHLGGALFYHVSIRGVLIIFCQCMNSSRITNNVHFDLKREKSFSFPIERYYIDQNTCTRNQNQWQFESS